MPKLGCAMITWTTRTGTGAARLPSGVNNSGFPLCTLGSESDFNIKIQQGATDARAGDFPFCLSSSKLPQLAQCPPTILTLESQPNICCPRSCQLHWRNVCISDTPVTTQPSASASLHISCAELWELTSIGKRQLIPQLIPTIAAAVEMQTAHRLTVGRTEVQNVIFAVENSA